jgi:DNA repair exonuclease SbcCD ATPase subunit
MTDLAKADPKVMQVADDLVVGAMDFPGAKDIAARLKKTIPPQLLDDGQGADKDTQLAQAQGQLQRVTQEAQALNAHAQQVEQQAQQLAQENAQLKAAQQSKAQELQLKVAHEQAQQELERLKIQLEAEKLALERAKVQMELHEKQVALQPAIDAQAQAAQIETLHALHAQMVALQEHLAQTLQAVTAAEAARQQPKTFALHRDAAGTLVGEVHDQAGQVVRRLALARSGNGYQGEVG